LGAAFLRAVRLSFFRSSLSSILVVSATYNLFHCNLFRNSRASAHNRRSKSTRCEVYGNRDWMCRKTGACAWGAYLGRIRARHSIDFQGTMEDRPECDQPARLRPFYRFRRAPHPTRQSTCTMLTGVRHAFRPNTPRARAGNEPF
jgi:hypothetical protein